jgi:hypothetical protein
LYFFSVVYTRNATDTWEPPFGECLGEMTDEIEKDFGRGAYIRHFIAAGPKTYQMLVKSALNQDEERVMKAKGFPHTVTLERTLKFEKLRELIHTYIDDRRLVIPLPIEYIQFRKTPRQEVLTLVSIKNFQVVYDKRVLLPDGNTLPRGY